MSSEEFQMIAEMLVVACKIHGFQSRKGEWFSDTVLLI